MARASSPTLRQISAVFALLALTACRPSTSDDDALQLRSKTSALDNTRFENVKVYGGTVRFSSAATKRTFTEGGSTYTIECTHQGAGIAYLTQDAGSLYAWTGRFQGTVTIKCIQERDIATQFWHRTTWTLPSKKINTLAVLYMTPEATPYEGPNFRFLYGHDINTSSAFITTLSESSVETYTSTVSKPALRSPGIGITPWPIPASGLELSVNVTEDHAAPCGAESQKIPYNFSFQLSPMDLNEVKLLIEPPDNYAEWRPSAPSVDEADEMLDAPPLDGVAVAFSSGPPQSLSQDTSSDIFNSFTVTATLLGPEALQAKNIVFRLKSSTVPGVSSNWPMVGGQYNERDLEMRPAQGTALDITDATSGGETLQEGRTPDSLYDSATVHVDSFDWGAYGEMTADATLPDGRIIHGVVVSAPDEIALRIPKRKSDSFIADNWKQQYQVENLEDTDDNENIPLGDGNSGDGLTLYEEYRGFQEKGKHTSGNPKAKDYFLFVDSSLKGIAGPGIGLFASTTMLHVHQLKGGEFPPSEGRGDFNLDHRVINFNRAPDGRHLVDQHLVVLRRPPGNGDTTTGESRTYRKNDSANGTPKDISVVELSTKTLASGALNIKTVVAHELGHTVNIYHHGDAEVSELFIVRTFDAFIQAKDAKGKVDPLRITELFDADTFQELFPSSDLRRAGTATKVTFSPTSGNQYSGFEDCYMRYTGATLVREGTDTSTSVKRLWIRPPEQAGEQLCSRKTGVTFNAGPRSRHGSALRGDCIHQILVNDRIAAPQG
ncbi:hypothetical protein [Corallococcus exiguus]|uniref:hypothetical protein n=1 Tax=Corallococcus exiguus TaxID=83462 RepID=UPI00149500E7|nr:hypothetical protein [Corallococcus exiguus]NPD29865.1 hypothetical protein [Corallococcus exiguus]